MRRERGWPARLRGREEEKEEEDEEEDEEKVREGGGGKRCLTGGAQALRQGGKREKSSWERARWKGGLTEKWTKKERRE